MVQRRRKMGTARAILVAAALAVLRVAGQQMPLVGANGRRRRSLYVSAVVCPPQAPGICTVGVNPCDGRAMSRAHVASALIDVQYPSVLRRPLRLTTRYRYPIAATLRCLMRSVCFVTCVWGMGRELSAAWYYQERSLPLRIFLSRCTYIFIYFIFSNFGPVLSLSPFSSHVFLLPPGVICTRADGFRYAAAPLDRGAAALSRDDHCEHGLTSTTTRKSCSRLMMMVSLNTIYMYVLFGLEELPPVLESTMLHDLMTHSSQCMDIIVDAPTPRDRQYHAQQQHSLRRKAWDYPPPLVTGVVPSA